MLKQSFFISIFIVLLNISCIKEDLDKVSLDSLNPSVSMPISSLTINNTNFNGGVSLTDSYKAGNTPILTEYIHFNLGNLFSNSEYIENMLIRLDITNNFPADLEVYAYYLDEDENIIRSIVSHDKIDMDKPLIDAKGDILKPTNILHDEYFTPKDIPSLVDCRRILVRIFINDLELTQEVIDKMGEYNILVNIAVRSALDIPTDKIK